MLEASKMCERFVTILVLLSLVEQFASLSPSIDFQQVILKKLGLKEPPLVKSNRATACIDYLKSLENTGDEYNEIDCLDQLSTFLNFQILLFSN